MSTQIVFLIDVNQQQDNHNETACISNSICLTSLRLLHFLSAKNEKRGYAKKAKHSHTAIKWGYKFFTTKTHVSKFEQHKFKDFKLKHFEEFECEVQHRLENAHQTCNNQNIGKKPASVAKPGECTQRALAEVLSDFPWEKPDIMSPVRKRNLKNEKRKFQHSQNNFVVLFSTCPNNAGEMKLFTGRQVPDDEVLLDSLLPLSLFQQFCNLSRLSLSWCDTRFSHLMTSADSDVVKIVQDALVKTRGNLFHISSVVQTNQTESCPKSESSFSCHNGLLPFTTLFNNILLARTTATNSTEPCKARLALDNGLVYDVSISPSVTTSEGSTVVSDSTDIATHTPNITTTTPGGGQLSNSVWKQYGMTSSLAFRKQPCSRVFVCGNCRQSAGNTDDDKTRGVLMKTLKYLKTRNRILLNNSYQASPALSSRSLMQLLLCQQTGELAVLQPLTDHSATLSLVPTADRLHVEKLLLPHGCHDDVKVKASDSTDDLIGRLMANTNYNRRKGLPVAVSSGTGGSTDLDCESLDRWRVPGCKPTLSSLIDKLNERISELDFLSPDEAGQLRLLQRAYKSENKPPGLRDTAGEKKEAGNQSLLDESRDDGNQRLEPSAWTTARKGNQASVSRGKMIYDLCRNREPVKGARSVEKGGEGGQGKVETDLPAQLFDFTSDDDLKAYLTSTYTKLVSGEISDVDSTVQTFAAVVLHFMKQANRPDPQNAAANLLGECLLETGAQLREKHANRTDDGCTQEKIAEYQCQVLLRLEILSSLVGKDQTLGEDDTNDEIVGLLRALSFIGETGLLPGFLQSCLLTNYMDSLPRTLANIYDELMQPLPDTLAAILSPTASADHSVLDTSLIGDLDPPSSHTRSQMSVGPGSNCSLTGVATGPKPRGSRKLVHHPSLADFGPKRQIFVEKPATQKEKSSRKKTKDHASKRPRDKVSKNLFDRGRRGGVKLERRQSVAVMERTCKTPKKSKSKLLAKSPAARLMSPMRARLVADTPCHRLVSQAFEQAQNIRRHSLATEVTTQVIAESPVKDIKSTSLKDTPTKAKRAKALLRRSFYSAGPINRTRNLTQYFQLADKISGRKRHPSIAGDEKPKPHKLISIENMEGFKSPNKNSSFLLSQLISSPSPAKVTPRKLTMTPSKEPPDSPSMNTRLKSASLFASPSSNLLLSPVSRRKSRPVLVMDSDIKKVNLSPKRTPEKSPVGVCGTISAGLDSPSHNSRHKISATPTRRSVRAALFAKSPAANRYQSPRRDIGTASPRELLSVFSSPQKRASPRKLAVANEIPARMSPRKSRGDTISSYKSPRTASNPSHPLFASNQCDLPSDRNNKSIEIPATNNSLKTTERPVKILNFVSDDCSSKCLSTNGKETAVQRTPSPKKKTKTKTPESFDKWHRRKPRFTQNSPSIKRLTQNTTIFVDSECEKTLEPCGNIHISSPERLSIHTKHSNLIAEDDNITKRVFSSRSKKRNLQLSPESILSPRKRRRTNTSVPDTVSLQPDSICNVDVKQVPCSPIRTQLGTIASIDSQVSGDAQMKAVSSPKGRKRGLLLSPESFMSPSKRQRTHRSNLLHSLSKESSFPIGSQGFDVTGTFSQSSQISTASSLDYFSSTNDDVFLTQERDSSQCENQPELFDIDDLENIDSLLPGRFTRQNSAAYKQKLNIIKTNSMDDTADRSESPIFGNGKKRHRSRENGKLFSILENVDNRTTANVNETYSPKMKNSPACKSASVSSSPTITISPGSKKYSPVVSAKSLMHLIQSPLLSSSSKESRNSPRGNLTMAAGERSRRSLKLQNL